MALRHGEIHLSRRLRLLGDQYELVATTVPPKSLVEGLKLFDAALERPVTKFYIYNSPQIWRKISPMFAAVADYIFYLKPDRVKIHAPHLDRPVEFSINWEKALGGGGGVMPL